MSKQKQIINRIKALVKEYKSLNEAMLTITKQDMDRLHSGEEVDIDGTQLKFVDESVNEAKLMGSEYDWEQFVEKMNDGEDVRSNATRKQTYVDKETWVHMLSNQQEYEKAYPKVVIESVSEVNKDNIPYTYKNQEEVDYLDSKGKIGSGTVVGVAKDYGFKHMGISK
jgi:hypothetical protein